MTEETATLVLSPGETSPVVVRDTAASTVVQQQLCPVVVRGEAPAARVVQAYPDLLAVVERERPAHVVHAGFPGPRGPAGSGGGSTYTHIQSTPDVKWTINHNLGFRPTIEVRTAGGAVIDAEVVHGSLNLSTVSLSVPLAGAARCV